MFETSFLSLPEIPINALLLPNETPAIAKFIKKLDSWVGQELGALLQNLEVVNVIHQVKGEKIKEQHVCGRYYEIVEAVWKVVLAGKLDSDHYAPVLTRAAEGEILGILQSQVEKLREKIERKVVPFAWADFNLDIEAERATILDFISDLCLQKSVPANFVSRSRVDIQAAMEAKKKQNDETIQVEVDRYVELSLVHHQKTYLILREFEHLRQHYYELASTAGMSFPSYFDFPNQLRIRKSDRRDLLPRHYFARLHVEIRTLF